jgi:hypothetical protein
MLNGICLTITILTIFSSSIFFINSKVVNAISGNLEQASIIPVESLENYLKRTMVLSESTDTVKKDIIPPGHDKIDSFVSKGRMNSVIYSTLGNWESKGSWELVVEEGKVNSFATAMSWNNGTKSHTHEILNFESDGGKAILNPDNSATIEGRADVGTNDKVTYPDSHIKIDIKQGKVISISVDDEDTEGHFANQAVHGTIDVLKSCSSKPGKDMFVPEPCI